MKKTLKYLPLISVASPFIHITSGHSLLIKFPLFFKSFLKLHFHKRMFNTFFYIDFLYCIVTFSFIIRRPSIVFFQNYAYLYRDLLYFFETKISSKKVNFNSPLFLFWSSPYLTLSDLYKIENWHQIGDKIVMYRTFSSFKFSSLMRRIYLDFSTCVRYKR